MIKDKKILITGGAGSIGSELVRQLASHNQVYILDSNETDMFDLAEEFRTFGRVGDIRDEKLFDDIINEFGDPDIIFHCAALKHVLVNELDPIEAVKTNILGTWNIIKFAKRTGAKLINISTDKVVSGESIMGLTKKISERMVKNAGFVSVRFGNVIGSRGSLLPIWEKQFKAGKPLTITDERMERYFMSIQSACELVIKAEEIGQSGQIILLDMGLKKNIMELKNELYGCDYPIKITGKRPGEILSERTMTDDEQMRAVKFENFWII